MGHEPQSLVFTHQYNNPLRPGSGVMNTVKGFAPRGRSRGHSGHQRLGWPIYKLRVVDGDQRFS